jgi:hypothetical protein
MRACGDKYVDATAVFVQPSLPDCTASFRPSRRLPERAKSSSLAESVGVGDKAAVSSAGRPRWASNWTVGAPAQWPRERVVAGSL